MATKLDNIMKGKYSLNATNAPNVDEETRQQKNYIPHILDVSQQKSLVNNNDESNLDEGSVNANLSEMIRTNKIRISLKHNSDNND